jgi:hypothetical protein
MRAAGSRFERAGGLSASGSSALLNENKDKGEEPRLLPFAVPSPGYDSGPKRNYFFTGAITSLAALATRNLTTVLALILMAAPV